MQPTGKRTKFKEGGLGQPNNATGSKPSGVCDQTAPSPGWDTSNAISKDYPRKNPRSIEQLELENERLKAERDQAVAERDEEIEVSRALKKELRDLRKATKKRSKEVDQVSRLVCDSLNSLLSADTLDT
jgi:hypothetical protein